MFWRILTIILFSNDFHDVKSLSWSCRIKRLIFSWTRDAQINFIDCSFRACLTSLIFLGKIDSDWFLCRNWFVSNFANEQLNTLHDAFNCTLVFAIYCVNSHCLYPPPSKGGRTDCYSSFSCNRMLHDWSTKDNAWLF